MNREVRMPKPREIQNFDSKSRNSEQLGNNVKSQRSGQRELSTLHYSLTLPPVLGPGPFARRRGQNELNRFLALRPDWEIHDSLGNKQQKGVELLATPAAQSAHGE